MTNVPVGPEAARDGATTFLAPIARAFSLRHNLRLLVQPGEGRLRPIDGLRALSLLWVVLFHAGWYLWQHLPLETYGTFVHSPWMLPVWRGDFGVDVFFVLSGHLIAGMLVDEKDRTGKIRIALFTLRRLGRLWPALGVAALANALLVEDRPQYLWANLLYVSNFVPIFDAAMGWTWSLSIEEQFYLFCPWFVLAVARLQRARRLLAPLALAGVLVGVCAFAVNAGSFHAHDSEIVIDRHLLVWARGYDALYAKPWMRAGPLLAGVASAYVFRLPRAMHALGRHRVLAGLGLLAALAIAALCTHWPLAAEAPRALEIAWLAAYRSLFGVAVAYVLLLSLSEHPLGVAIGRALSSRLLYPVAQLAYCAYLVNPIATVCVDRALAPVAPSGCLAFALLLPIDALVTLVAALALHLLVERPFMELRPRG